METHNQKIPSTNMNPGSDFLFTSKETENPVSFVSILLGAFYFVRVGGLADTGML